MYVTDSVNVCIKLLNTDTKKTNNDRTGALELCSVKVPALPASSFKMLQRLFSSGTVKCRINIVSRVHYMNHDQSRMSKLMLEVQT